MPESRQAARSQAERVDSTTKAYREEWARIKDHLVVSKKRTKDMSAGAESSLSNPQWEWGWRVPKGQQEDLETISYNFWKIRKNYDSMMRVYSEKREAPSAAVKFQNHELTEKNKREKKTKNLSYSLDVRLDAILFISKQLQDENIYFQLCIKLFDSTQIYNKIQNIPTEFEPQKGLAWALQEATKEISKKYNIREYFKIFQNEGYLGNPIDRSFLSSNLDSIMGWTSGLGYRPVFNNSTHDNLSMQFLPRVRLLGSYQILSDFGRPDEDWEFEIAIRKKPLNRYDFEGLCERQEVSHSFSGSTSSELWGHTDKVPETSERNEEFNYYSALIIPEIIVNWVIAPGPDGEPVAAFEKRIETLIRIGGDLSDEYVTIFPVQSHCVELIQKSRLDEISNNRQLGIIFGRKKGSGKNYANTLVDPEKSRYGDGLISIIEAIMDKYPIKIGTSMYEYINDFTLKKYLGFEEDTLFDLPQPVESEIMNLPQFIRKYSEEKFQEITNKEMLKPSDSVFEFINDISEFPMESNLLDLENSCQELNGSSPIIAMGLCSHIKTSVLNDFRAGLSLAREKKYKDVFSRI